MKAKIPPQFSAAEQKALTAEINRQCVEATQRYELDVDTCFVYSMRRHRISAKKSQEIYADVFQLRKELQEYYQGEKNDNMAETAMRHKLLQDGIDMKKLYEREKYNRYVVTLIE